MIFGDLYRDRKVFITGHTGFKGSWLSLWLLELGAKIRGYALKPPTCPSHFDLLDLDVERTEADIRDHERLEREIRAFEPEIVFHLAAQSLVRKSYREPLATFETNVLGTVYVLEACRKTPSVRAVVIVTSDKCYEIDRASGRRYTETDPVGGYDPYSASKGCSEIVSASFRRSFFPVSDYGKSHQCLVATARAGNAVGGGDWGEERLVPDLVRAATRNEKALIRNPFSRRPWQHVLEPLSGYLLLAQRLFHGDGKIACPWNFGPEEENPKTVLEVVKSLKSHWEAIDFETVPSLASYKETSELSLDPSMASKVLGWRTVWDQDRMIKETASWYRGLVESGYVLSTQQLVLYERDAAKKGIAWTQG